MTLVIAPIVEGQMEQRCVERLLQRIRNDLLQSPEDLRVLRPIRGKRDALVHVNGIALASKLEEACIAIRHASGKDPQARGFLLVLLDAEGDCPRELAPWLLQTAQSARSDVDIACVLARKMFENWIVAGAATLGGIQGLPAELKPPDNPEERSGPKWLDQQIRGQNRRRKYDKTVDAPVFVQKMDLEQCLASSRSFRKLHKELQARLAAQPAEENESPAAGQAPQALEEDHEQPPPPSSLSSDPP